MNNNQKLDQWMASEQLNDACVAEKLSQITGDRIHRKTVQRWRAFSEAKYARTCPGWVLVVLEVG